MALKSSGQISIGGSVQSESINLEICRSATAQTNLNETFLRTFAGVPSGQISLSDFYGKQKSTITLTTVQANTTNACETSANTTYYFGADTKLFQTELCTAASTGYYGTGASTYYQVTSADGTYTGPTACSSTTTTTSTTAAPNCGEFTCTGTQLCCEDAGNYCCESDQICCFGTCVAPGTCT